MSTDNDTQVLRLLLEKYYRGETTPAQERAIALLLDSEAGLSGEFDADRRLFRALAQECAPAPAPPEWLEPKLRQMTRRKFTRRALGRIPRWVRLFSAGAAAACAAALIWVATTTVPASDSYLSERLPASTDTVLTIANPAHESGKAYIAKVEEAPAAEIPHTPVAAPPKPVAAVSPDTVPHTTPDTFTSPEEAAKFTCEILAMTGKRLQDAAQTASSRAAEITGRVNDRVRSTLADVFSKTGIN